MPNPFRSNGKRLALIALLFEAGLFYACATGLVPATGEKRYLGYTWEQERQIGQQASKQVAALFGLYQDPKLEDYVNRVGQRVLAASDLRAPQTAEEFRKTPVKFSILDNPIVNAMALPGGYVYVTRGMLSHLNSEDQLATVLAHEIGHVAARHAARQAWQQKLGQGLLLGGAILGQQFGLPAEQILNLGGTAIQLLFLRHSREDELEADQLSVQYASAAGYDPREVTGLFESINRMQQKEGQAMPGFLSTHPNPGDRIQRIKELTANLPPARRRTADLGDYYGAIEGLVVGEDPRQGFVKDNVFYHPALRFRFPVPRGFKVANQPTQVIMVEAQNRAILGFTSTGEKSLQSATSQFLNQPGLRVVETRRTSSGGFPAVVVVADAQVENRQAVRLLADFVEYRGRVYYFMGYTAPQLFNAYRDTFLATAQGFRAITDTAILNRQPVRLALEHVSREAPFRDLIPREIPDAMQPEDLAILNQVELNQAIRPGTVLKIPQAARN